jgi:hypothetical protein
VAFVVGTDYLSWLLDSETVKEQSMSVDCFGYMKISLAGTAAICGCSISFLEKSDNALSTETVWVMMGSLIYWKVYARNGL